MTVYVDAMVPNGWQGNGRIGRRAPSFHMFSDTEDHDELHESRAPCASIRCCSAWTSRLRAATRLENPTVQSSRFERGSCSNGYCPPHSPTKRPTSSQRWHDIQSAGVS